MSHLRGAEGFQYSPASLFPHESGWIDSKRSQGRDGGRCDAQDRDPLETAMRELDEECGIRLEREQMERELPCTVARRLTPPYLLVAPFVFRVPADDQLNRSCGLRLLPPKFKKDPRPKTSSVSCST